MKIVLIHGIGGYKKESFFKQLEEDCKKLGLEVIIPSMKGYRENGTLEEWFKIFENETKNKIDNNTIILGQSLGTQFAVKFLAKTKANIKAYISCAGPANVTNMKPLEDKEREKMMLKMCEQFKPTDDEFLTVKNLPFPKYSFYSDNDMFFDFENLNNYSKLIGSKQIILHKGHFNIAQGVTEMPEIIDLIKEITNLK